MNERIMKGLADLKDKQQAGVQMPCPRCGRDTMKPSLETNALSRHADLYICDECGTAEAMLDFMRNPLPIEQWAAFREDVPRADFKDISGKEALKIVRAEHIPRMIRIFRESKAGDTDPASLRSEAIRECPGLTQIWLQPFQALYRTADGEILVRFRQNGSGVEIACDLLPGTK